MLLSRSRWLRPGAGFATALLVVMLLAVLPTATRIQPVYAQPGVGDAFAWTVGGPGPDEARQLAVDAAGNLYVAGVFTSSVDADPGPDSLVLTSAGDTDIFLAKYDPEGRVVWAWSIGGPSADRVSQVALDPLGNIYLAGGFSGEVDFAPSEGEARVLAGSERHGFIAKYDPSGTLVWVTPLELSGDDVVLALALDSAGNVVAAGLAAMSTVPGEPAPLQRGDAFALRLDANGRLVWSAILPTRSEGIGPVAVVISPFADVYLAASYTDTLRVALGGGLIDTASAGGSDVLVLKLSPAGGLVWARSIGGLGADAPGTGGLALDGDGNVLLAGTFDDMLDVAGDGAFVLEGQGQRDAFLISLDEAGAVRWAASIGGPGDDGAVSVATDAAQYTYVAGWFSGALSTEPGLEGRAPVGNGQAGAADALLAKFTPDGRTAWVRGFGGRGVGPGESSLALAALVDLRGDLLLAGRLFGTDVDFDPDAGTAIVSSAGQSDAFVAKFGPSGVLLRR